MAEYIYSFIYHSAILTEPDQEENFWSQALEDLGTCCQSGIHSLIHHSIFKMAEVIYSFIHHSRFKMAEVIYSSIHHSTIQTQH